MRCIMADMCGKEEGAERRLRYAHVNGSLMKQYDRCIIEILPILLSLSFSLRIYRPCIALFAIRVSVFPRYSAPRSFIPPFAGSMHLCPLMANSSSLTAHNFRDAIAKDGVRAGTMEKNDIV